MNYSSIIRGIWSTYPKNREHQEHQESSDSGPLLDLVKHFYHEPSGLHNEGVWHNCLMAINYYCYCQSRENGNESENNQKEVHFNEKVKQAMNKVVKSVIELNFDRESRMFHQRTETDIWSHADAKHNMLLAQLYQRTEHVDRVFKLISQVVALLMNTIVIWKQESGSDNGDDDKDQSLSSLCDDPNEQLCAIHRLFYNEKHGMYLTKKQYVSPTTTEAGDEPQEKVEHSYFRAVDHALLLIAIVLMEAKGVALHLSNEKNEIISYDQLKDNLRRVLLHEFGFNGVETIRGYIVKMDDKEQEEEKKLSQRAHRFLWQEIWVYLALLISSPDPSKDPAVRQGVEQFFDVYLNEENGLLYNELKPETYALDTLKTGWINDWRDAQGKKRSVYISPITNYFFNTYTGDNALAYGLLRACESYGCDWLAQNHKIQQFMQTNFHQGMTERLIVTNQEAEKDDGQCALLGVCDLHHSSAIWSNSEYLFALQFLAHIRQFLSTTNKNNH